MPCRAAPPPPPPPHSTLDLTPSPPALSNPLVYRLRTCCLQEFLPRVSIVQRSSISTTGAITSTTSATAPLRPFPSSSSSSESHSSLYCCCSPNSSSLSSTSVDHTTRPCPRSHHAVVTPRRSGATQLSALFNSDFASSCGSNACCGIIGNSSSSNHTIDNVVSPSSCPSIAHAQAQQDTPACSSTATSGWQHPPTNIPLAQLQTALAHRFLRWAVSEQIVVGAEQDQQRVEQFSQEQQQQQQEKDAQEKEQEQRDMIDSDQGTMHNQTLSADDELAQMKSIAAAGQDWAAAHDLVWPEGDYYMAQKSFIREGVAHLKRGRRYIFVEPVLGPATSYLYPRWNDSTPAGEGVDGVLEEAADEGRNDAVVAPTTTTAADELEEDKNQDDDVVQNEVFEDVDGKIEGAESMNGDDKRTDEDDESEDRAYEASLAVASDKGAERVEKEETDETANGGDNPSSTTTALNNSNTSSSSSSNNSNSNSNSTTTTNNSANAASNTTNNNNVNSHEDNSARHLPSEFLEPYSPLLDPSTDGQDQFEYGLYELQYIPKIQRLLPHQFLPTRQSFIVHLDEDRPTLASPVPMHSKRSECRCQLMMRKVLMHRDLFQVWPPIPPVRTLQERIQEAEEEARMLEIKQKVQMQTKNWRETLQTQVVACG
ncbi:hypothetical protein BC939DRAFT_507429 [Gamsiella multidivaricata]|uniref:uncharacterized protein n=1 Tax=Gamsiella multidivaricata TaxID=101098 RepID=UPI00221F8B77|nr:uncharacterized protein BC939DRAFT_507429 [Gamsiella multidivaricata]KAI7817395.1 hypothetical protein BC939DRAFT_507429 [Gamsiella multidivaricata]